MPALALSDDADAYTAASTSCVAATSGSARGDGAGGGVTMGERSRRAHKKTKRRSPRPTRPSPRRRAPRRRTSTSAAWRRGASRRRELSRRIAAGAAHDAAAAARAPAAAVVAAGERAVKRWLRLCAPGGASPEKPPEKPPQAMTTPSRFAQTRRRRRPAPSCPPPSTPSLRAIFDASKTKPVPRGADCAQTLRKFYAIHNPSLLPRAAQIAREWRGSEETLFALLRYKYGSGTSSAACVSVGRGRDGQAATAPVHVRRPCEGGSARPRQKLYEH